MDKNAIKKYAVWARNELIERVSQKADQYEISADADPDADSARGVVLTPDQKKQRAALIQKVKEKGQDQVIEEVAYTWFNRFSALRFMEVNNYLPSRVRVFTDAEGNFKPEILTEAIHLELDGLDREKVYALKDANDNDELFKYLIITQCNALSSVLPGMFQKIADYTELLFPDNLLREGSVIEQMVTMIPEDDWKDQVQIIGWLYQYYNTEPKDKVFADLKKNKKITKEKIPAATQLFTPDWIVRYMVENSLGRLWVEGHPNDDLKANWKYYLEEAEQEPEVRKQLDEIHKEYSALKPEDIRAVDPCMGSGHIICYMFDVLMQIYEAYGYTARDAASSIVQNNLYGLDIDDRAAQLAYFSVMMKARQYDRRFLSRGIQPHVYAIMESNRFDPNMIDSFTAGRKELKSAMNSLASDLHDAKEYGSILDVKPVDFPALYARFDEIRNQNPNMYTYQILEELLPFVQMAETMAQKYHTVCTNPPYMGSRKSMNPQLKKYVEKYYPFSKSDLYAVFIERAFTLAKKHSFVAMITQQSFMFTDDYKELRVDLSEKHIIINMAHLGSDAFEEISGEVVQTVAFVMTSKIKSFRFNGLFSRLLDYSCDEKPIHLTNRDNLYIASWNDMRNVKAMPIAYWLSPQMRHCFDVGTPFEEYGNPRAGITTGENDRFMRTWSEVDFSKVGLHFKSIEEFHKSGYLYIPYNKGGKQIRWYGNNDYVLMFDTVNYHILENQGNHLPSKQYYCQRCITWSDISGRSFAARYCDYGTIFDVKGSCGFPEESRFWLSIAILNSKLTPKFIDSLNPTTTTQVGDLKRIPVLSPQGEDLERINKLASECVTTSKNAYDMFEESWDFSVHPLICYKVKTIQDAWEHYKKDVSILFDNVKKNEEEINRILIKTYGLGNEITPDVKEEAVTLRVMNILEAIKTFVSYSVGCMMGRYSLDVDGLAYAGGDWDTSKYKTFIPDKDAIIPITDDEYFADDIVGRFVEFVRTVYGSDTLEENLKFIADALDEKGSTSREVIRNYFLNDFYKDHLKTYQKRPIYWLFDSGKKNGFKCLVYMHRYQPDTIARIRTDYVHEQQARYRTAISGLERQINGAPTSERVRLNKQLTKLKDQAEETRLYEEKIHHLADQMISIDLDDGVKHNYAIFQDVLAKIK
jgi:hypothetical protein